MGALQFEEMMPTVNMFKLFLFFLLFTLTFVDCEIELPCRDSQGLLNFPCKKTPKPEDCRSGELVKLEYTQRCCPAYQACASAEGESCSRPHHCATGLECRKTGIVRHGYSIKRCFKKNDCEAIKGKIARNEENLKDILTSAAKVIDDLTRMKAENQKCFTCSDPKTEYPEYPNNK